MKMLAAFVIRFYQALHGTFFWGTCRFHPTCSHYALEAIEVHGVLRGTLMSILRVLRCQPLCKGGWDPVPPARMRRNIVPRRIL
jgi:putative membrane protein insertion efficiency factor